MGHPPSCSPAPGQPRWGAPQGPNSGPPKPAQPLSPASIRRKASKGAAQRFPPADSTRQAGGPTASAWLGMPCRCPGSPGVWHRKEGGVQAPSVVSPGGGSPWPAAASPSPALPPAAEDPPPPLPGDFSPPGGRRQTPPAGAGPPGPRGRAGQQGAASCLARGGERCRGSARQICITVKDQHKGWKRGVVF